MKKIDCLLIGYYKSTTSEIYDQLHKIGIGSGSFRDFNLGVINYNKEQLSLKELHNKIVLDFSTPNNVIKDVDTFNAGVSYLGSYLNKNNISFDYITSMNDEIDRFERILSECEVKTVAILTTLYVTPDPIINIINKIKKINKSVKVIVGGPYISNLCRTQNDEYLEYLMSNVIDADFFINSSQGEFALVNLISAIKNNKSVENIENIFYLKDNVLNKNNQKIEQNILSQNMIDWSLFNTQNKKFVNIRTAISCPFSCAFCGFPEHAGEYQTVDVELIEAELNCLVQQNKSLKSIYFIDDTFNVPKDRFKDILKMIIRNKFNFKWHSYFRCQFADEEIVSLMKESGCEGVFLGIESGSDTILKNMNKKSTIDDYRKGIELLKKSGIMTFGAFITGFPGETFKTVYETVKFIENSGLDFFRTQLWFCEHITPIWKRKEEFNIKGEGFDWSHNTMNYKIACTFIEKMFCDVKNVTWLPQYDFDYESVFRLLDNGMNLEQIKAYIRKFNDNVKEKLLNRPTAELSAEQYNELYSCIFEAYRTS